MSPKPTFPERYIHESSHELSLALNHIAVACASTLEVDRDQALEQILHLGSWELEQASEERDVVVNHTERVLWFRSKKPLSSKSLLDLQELVGHQLDWIGPVYEFPPEVSRNPICLLPDRLVVGLMNDSVGIAQKIDQLLLERFGLINCSEITRYLGSFRLFLLPREMRWANGSKTIFDIRQLLLKSEFVAKGVCAATIDSMPMLRHTPPKPRDKKGYKFPPLLDELFSPPLTQGDGTGVRVAVIDAEGFELNHPALQAAFVAGRKFYDDGSPTGGVDSSPTAAQGNSGSHGTRCAGIIGARPAMTMIADPNYIVGMAPGCSIVPLYVTGYVKSLVAAAIGYAADINADVISISDSEVGLDGSDPATNPVANKIDFAYTEGTLICAATMNANLNDIHYPAGHTAVMACGASNFSNDRCNPCDDPWGSNYGNSMSVAALGLEIKTTGLSNAYTTLDGTSAATPQVAALAAILISTFPVLKDDPQTTKNIIEQSAQKVGRTTVDAADNPVCPPGPALTYSTIKANGRWERELGYGIITVAGATQKAQQMLGAATDTTPPAAPIGLRIN